MDNQKNLLDYISEWWKARKANQTVQKTNVSRWLPTPSNVVFTLLIVGLLIVTQQAWATSNYTTNVSGLSATTINYQGRLAAPDGTPQDGTFGMSFALWDAATGGNIIWGPENHTAIPVSDGLFNVGLGSQTSGGIPTTTWNGDRYLEITVSGETLLPRELIRSVPIAGMALAVPNASITSDKLSLSSGEVCLSDDVTINLSGGYDVTPIPGLALNFSLDQPSKVLIWMNGLAKFDQDGVNAVNVELLVDGTNIVSSHSYYDNQWDDVKGQRILSLDKGSHQILLQGRSALSGVMTIHGRDAWKTCAYYLILGEQ